MLVFTVRAISVVATRLMNSRMRWSSVRAKPPVAGSAGCRVCSSLRGVVQTRFYCEGHFGGRYAIIEFEGGQRSV